MVAHNDWCEVKWGCGLQAICVALPKRSTAVPDHDGHQTTLVMLFVAASIRIRISLYSQLNSFRTFSVVFHSSSAKSSLLASSLASSRTPYGTKYFPLYLSRSSKTWRDAAAHAGVYPPSCGEMKKSENPQLINPPRISDVKSLTFPSVSSARAECR
jgi:hypothetical protein